MKRVLVSLSLVSLSLVLGLSATRTAHADDSHPHGFNRPFALGGYATGWAGGYLGGGVGGRLRWQPFRWLGVDLFSEHLLVQNPGSLRHDHPIGFNVFVPLRLTRDVQLLPLFGFCAVFSFIEPAQKDGPRADDVLFGVHGGAGVEWAPLRDWSLFLDVQAVGYLGHGRSAQGWTGSVDDNLTATGVVQASFGLQVHL